MLSKKLILSIILIAFVINITQQLTISEAAKDKIKNKINEVINLFKEDALCKEPKWCDGFKVGDCETPQTNKTVCCLYCVKTTKAHTANPKTTTISTTHEIKEEDKITLPTVMDEEEEEDKITLPETSIEDVEEKTTEAVEHSTKAPKLSKTTKKDETKSRVLTEMLLEVDNSNPNEVIIFKKSFERVQKECPKDIGISGCTIVEKCHDNSACLHTERCCIKNCIRSCIAV